jgi:diguanylate cyclase (GGDEF)-like protein
MIQLLNQCKPREYRIITFLTVTSITGVLLIFIAVYNASRDLEIIHKVDNLHGFVQASLTDLDRADDALHQLAGLSSDNYQVVIVDNNSVAKIPDENLHDNFPRNMAELEQSRINKHGGYVEAEDRIYTWTMLPLTGSNTSVVLVHNFTQSTVGALARIYSKRLLVPAIFYIWLMVWVSLIIRFLTNRLRAQNETLEHMALHDSLTDLPNRTLLNNRLQKMIQDCRRNQRSFALAIIDLNEFKSVNDTLGHDHGDELLRLFAGRVRGMLHAVDTLARIGGDEFVLLLNDVDEESCIATCERIYTSISRPFCLREAEVNIGLSIGIAIFPEHGEESTTLMRNADLAMYLIKSKGGGINLYAGHQKTLKDKTFGMASSST